jgi:elongation factor G
MSTERVRNLGVVAHIDAGKTTVTERILFFAGVEHKIGEVDHGTTVMDWMEEERERGITITAAATTIPWRDHALHLIDTPGHVDFTLEVERCMRVLDGAVLVIDAVAGVQAQSETVWRQMKRHQVPAIAFVNKCDRPGADFLAASASLRKRLEAPSLPLQYPLYDGGELRGVVDLLTRTALEFSTEPGAGDLAPREVPLPDSVADEVGVLRAELVDTLAEEDDELLQAVLDEREPPVEALKAALRKRTIAGELVPVFCGAALRNVGVQPLIDAVVDYLPSPLDVPSVVGTNPKTGEPLERACDVEAPLAALAFKLQADTHGDVTFVRIYSGRLKQGDQIWNPRARKKERAQRILKVHADSREALDEALPGDIVALTGLKFTATGDTLCHVAQPVLLEALAFPEPVISMMVEPKSTVDRDKLRQALARLSHEDPSLHQREDEDTGQWMVSGMGELHLEVALHRLASDFNVIANMGKPRVAYRESARTAGRGAARVERSLGGKDVFGAVDLELAPHAAEPGAPAVRIDWSDDCAIPTAFRAALAESLELGAQVGPRFGYPLVAARITVLASASNPRVDAEVAFVQAGTLALRHAMQEATVDLLEPVMRFEIQTPEEFTSGIIADLNARRAEVSGLGVEETLRTVSGTVPLAHMFGYATAARSLSQGRASFSMEPAGFRVVPEDELAARGLVWD